MLIRIRNGRLADGRGVEVEIKDGKITSISESQAEEVETNEEDQ